MHKIYELKEMLCDELEKYGEKKELTAGTLDVVDKLAHAIKNIDKILESGDEEYSRRSYAPRRDARGRYSRENRMYSTDGYSMAGDVAMELKELMQDAPDAQTRQDIQRIVDRLQRM